METNKTYNPKCAFNRIKDWCDAHNIDVFDASDEPSMHTNATPGDRATITLNKSLSNSTKVYTFLHECGHHLINHKTERFDEGYAKHSFHKRTDRQKLRARIEILQEELEAWHRGFNLAKRLNIYINVDKFKRRRDKCIKSYARWASASRKTLSKTYLEGEIIPKTFNHKLASKKI